MQLARTGRAQWPARLRLRACGGRVVPVEDGHCHVRTGEWWETAFNSDCGLGTSTCVRNLQAELFTLVPRAEPVPSQR
jgi:hypothetical protein